MPTINLNATELYYESTGTGPPLLLIHGLGSSGDDWAFQRDDLARQHRLILPDLRGSGRSAKPPGPYSIAQFAADLWALVDALGIEYIDVLGFSLGGAVALEMALARPPAVRHPDPVQRARKLSHRYLAQMAGGAPAGRAGVHARTQGHCAHDRQASVSAARPSAETATRYRRGRCESPGPPTAPASTR